MNILFALLDGFAYDLARNGEQLVEDGLRGHSANEADALVRCLRLLLCRTVLYYGNEWLGAGT